MRLSVIKTGGTFSVHVLQSERTCAKNRLIHQPLPSPRQVDQCEQAIQLGGIFGKTLVVL
jgi:hypothetical protein